MQTGITRPNKNNKIMKALVNLATLSFISYIEFFIIAFLFTILGILDYEGEFDTSVIINTTEIILLSLSVVFSILRSYISYKQLYKSQPSDKKYSIVWSLWSRIIPIVNFIIPFNILRTLSKGVTQTNRNRRSLPTTITILQILVIICTISFIINTTPIELPMIPWIIYRLLVVISCGLFIYIIRKISLGQENK